jgi:hypothetical protein
LQLGEVAEIEAQIFGFAQKFYKSTALEFSTEPTFLPNAYYRDGLLVVRMFYSSPK